MAASPMLLSALFLAPFLQTPNFQYFFILYFSILLFFSSFFKLGVWQTLAVEPQVRVTQISRGVHIFVLNLLSVLC